MTDVPPQFFELTPEQIDLLGLASDRRWFAFLALDGEERRTYFLHDEAAFDAFALAITTHIFEYDFEPPLMLQTWGWPQFWA
ncbi:hypothetical protein [Amnibacterium kyonggiense]|uniref:Uncharacterized protein n=1 Tax=Amnibacterium kyonggiense TaxID=595671 RepID=A0A4R7FMJ8_9MICO|nr:hypothetical protein [Amnibacterium kyonggiense]TDS77705.1 hypothetical protein CLV52_2666 [Amnibacterium kyonggiense]